MIFEAMVTYKVNPQELRKARTAKGLSSKDFSKAVGVSPSFITDLEHGRRNCSVEVRDRILKFLGPSNGTLAT